MADQSGGQKSQQFFHSCVLAGIVVSQRIKIEFYQFVLKFRALHSVE